MQSDYETVRAALEKCCMKMTCSPHDDFQCSPCKRRWAAEAALERMRRDGERLDWCDMVAAKYPRLEHDGMTPMRRAHIDTAMEEMRRSGAAMGVQPEAPARQPAAGASTPTLTSEVNYGIEDDRPRCNTCGNPLMDHWRGRPCIQTPPPDSGRMAELDALIMHAAPCDLPRLHLVTVRELEAICPWCGGPREWSKHYCSRQCGKAAWQHNNKPWRKRMERRMEAGNE